MRFQLLIGTKMLKIKTYLACKLPDDVYVMIIKVKMPTTVGILTFKSMINFVLVWVERGKGFYHLGSCLGQQQYSLPKLKLIIGHPKTS